MILQFPVYPLYPLILLHVSQALGLLNLSSVLYAVMPGTLLALGLLALWELGTDGNNEDNYLYLVFLFFALKFCCCFFHIVCHQSLHFHTRYHEGSVK